jgi:hypothetical protein
MLVMCNCALTDDGTWGPKHVAAAVLLRDCYSEELCTFLVLQCRSSNKARNKKFKKKKEKDSVGRVAQAV